MIITKLFTWGMSHRLPSHDGLCKNIHGHEYKLEVSLHGSVYNNPCDVKDYGSCESSAGMIIDFKNFKSIVNDMVIDKLDHAYVSWDKDDPDIIKLFKDKDLKIVLVPFIPTAENLVQWIWDALSNRFNLSKIRLYETPTSWVETNTHS